MAYPENVDRFVEKLNKKQDGSVYVIEEAVAIIDGKYEGMLNHDNITTSTIKVYTGSKLTGEEITNVIVSVPSDTPWKRYIKIFADIEVAYITYETTGDQVEAEDINVLQDSITTTQAEVERYKTVNDAVMEDTRSRLEVAEQNKAEKTYVDTQLLLKSDKVNTYTKEETDARIQLVVDAAPEALNTLKEIADALNNDPDFAGTITAQLSTKVDKVPGKGLSTEDFTTIEKQKLAGIENGANNYVHPSTHPPSIIVQNSTNRFVTDAEKTSWNDANTKKHEHSNKPILDAITQLLVDGWNSAVEHIVDTVRHITTAERTLWNTVSNKVDKITGKQLSTEDYTTEEKNKLSGISLNANNYVHPTTAGNKHVPTGGATGQVLKYGGSSGTASWGNVDFTEITNMPDFVTQADLGQAGYGDMMKSTYDTNNNGKVDVAEVADSVAWEGVTGKKVFPVSNTTEASLTIPHGVAPVEPVNGDIWTTTSGLYLRLNGTTRTMAHTASWSTVSQAEAETGTATSQRLWTAQRVKQAIDANAMPKGPLTWNDLKGV
ncbi:hypothetical protein [Geosporobacter ferrireducens]|uniref:hypothetical protein n=1 Tax=Geosporobacter ferrireducens TaxID=1424294 RepID=UPI002353A8B7|nr:hypothetical protein [Geosporobacter ferrireducens]